MKSPAKINNFLHTMPACTFDQHQCDFGTCIAKSLICNGDVDCPDDNSDERNCPKPGLVPVPSPQPVGCRADTQIVCPDGKTRICEVQRCDGVENCPKFSVESLEEKAWDEKGCIQYPNVTFTPPIISTTSSPSNRFSIFHFPLSSRHLKN
jgi:hypothetical protein